MAELISVEEDELIRREEEMEIKVDSCGNDLVKLYGLLPEAFDLMKQRKKLKGFRLKDHYKYLKLKGIKIMLKKKIKKELLKDSFKK